MKALNTIALLLVVIGGLNWGLVGIAKFDLVATIFGDGTIGQAGTVGSIVYILVGLAAIWAISFFGKIGAEMKSARGPMAADEE